MGTSAPFKWSSVLFIEVQLPTREDNQKKKKKEDRLFTLVGVIRETVVLVGLVKVETECLLRNSEDLIIDFYFLPLSDPWEFCVDSISPQTPNKKGNRKEK